MWGSIHVLTPPSNKQTNKSLTSALTYENEYFYDSSNAMIIPTLKVKKKKTKEMDRLPWWLSGKNPPARQEMQVRCLGWEDRLRRGMATPLQYSG